MNKIELPCADCGFAAVPMTSTTLRRGSSVREPGEALCMSCSSSRSKLVRDVVALPNKIDQIKALRMVRGAA